MEVRDAETGEVLVVRVDARAAAAVSLSPGKRAKPAASCSLPPLRSPFVANLHDESQRQQAQQRSPNHLDHEETPVIFPETQSTRPMGAGVDWQSGQHARVERAELRFRMSLQGLRAELQRKDLDRAAREAIEIQILEKMKTQYAEQVRLMVVEEMEREMEREVEMRLELSVLGKERLRKKHDRDRGFYKAQIERVRAECELSLVASMAQYNLLR